jgi:hypothetical protein
MKKIIEVMAMVMVILMSLNGLGFGGNKATITVSATVIARINQFVSHQEPRITVTETDIKKGFIEIPSATILQIKTNDRKGYVLLFEGGSELFKEVLVTDKGRTIVLSPFGGLIHQPYSGSNIEVKDLSYKFFLRDNIQPGSYSWPFRVKASIL